MMAPLSPLKHACSDEMGSAADLRCKTLLGASRRLVYDRPIVLSGVILIGSLISNRAPVPASDRTEI